jgi:hypothetical protein
MRPLGWLFAVLLISTPALPQSAPEPKGERAQHSQAAPASASTEAERVVIQPRHGEQCDYSGPKWFGGFYCFFAAHDKFWVALGTLILALFTGALGFATIFLWRATKRLVVGADENARRQLRAYVSVTMAHVSSFAKDEYISVRFTLMNRGLTPARSLVHHSEIFVAPEPLPEDFILPGLTSRLSDPLTLFPSQDINGTKTAAHFFSQEEIRGIANGTARIYCYGMVYYETVFDSPATTTFCSNVTGAADMLQKLSTGYRKDDLKVSFQIARLGNSDT